ncbi:MAG: class I SAM-dependent methyltransferase [Actinobacteria bacterium]|nr:class I SAM-dependent methyltransferase [Actinomycetota bacterium]
MDEPPLAARARALAAEHGFGRSSIPQVGRLLHVLAAGCGRGRVAEIGTGYGVASAWIAAALDPGVPFVTVELDAERAAAASNLFRDDPDVRVLAGDWRELLPAEAPFDLLFLDGGHWKHRPAQDGEAAVALLGPRGTLVVDDFTPGRPGLDEARSFLFEHPRLAAVELLATPESAAIVAVRTR